MLISFRRNYLTPFKSMSTSFHTPQVKSNLFYPVAFYIGSQISQSPEATTIWHPWKSNWIGLLERQYRANTWRCTWSLVYRCYNSVCRDVLVLLRQCFGHSQVLYLPRTIQTLITRHPVAAFWPSIVVEI
jgi:hypothetical protein